jgi:hypothetical protein
VDVDGVPTSWKTLEVEAAVDVCLDGPRNIYTVRTRVPLSIRNSRETDVRAPHGRAVVVCDDAATEPSRAGPLRPDGRL